MGKTLLVSLQHPCCINAPIIDSITANAPGASGDNSIVSPVYSLASQHEGLWLLSGLESGGINLQSVRHDEGKQITCLRGHSSTVSVLNLAPDEQSVLSGSWDKTVIDWDLNTGKTIREFEGSGSQISALETRPLSSLPVPEVADEVPETNGTLSTDNADPTRPRGAGLDGNESDTKPDPTPNGTAASPVDSLFGGNDADSLFGDDTIDAAPPGGNFGDDEDDEFSRAIVSGIREQEDTQDQRVDHPPTGVDTVMGGVEEVPNTTIIKGEVSNQDAPEAKPASEVEATDAAEGPRNGLPHSEDDPSTSKPSTHLDQPPSVPAKADSTFLAASIDGGLRIWDKRQPKAVAKMTPKNVPPWCMNATWSPDGNFIYAGRRNGAVEEYSLHKGLRNAQRNFKLPNNSGAVSALRAMPNGRHLLW